MMGRRSTSPRRRARRALLRVFVALSATALALLIPVAVAAHPLGNFTINHYAGLSIGRDAIDLQVIIDKAEIPAFQDRQSADADGDGSVSDEEAATWADGSCSDLVGTLRVVADGAALSPLAVAEAVSFPPGAGGLSTLRLECRFRVAFPSAIDRPTTLTFSEASFPERIGWREIVATGDGTLLDTHGLPATSPSKELTAYPADLIAQPLDIRSASIEVRPAPTADATSGSATAAGGGVVAGAARPAEVASVAAVPGGVGNELPDIFRTRDLTPIVALLSIATAIALGAGHALTPGHGKTLMAAYLVGSRGRPIHAVGLGLSVAVSHTLGIFVLALVIIGAEGVLAPETIARTTPTIAAITIVAMGGWMVATEIRRRPRSRPRAVATNPAVGAHDESGDHDHDHAASDHHGGDHDHDEAGAHDQGVAGDPPGMHSHGGTRHSHLPPEGAGLSWRSLFVLGLAGGLIPSTSALLVLLASIASGRPVYGLLLVAAFGVGMAAVMTGVGVAMVLARGRLDGLRGRSPLGRLAAQAPLLASAFVLGLGVVLTYSAVAGRPVL